MYEPIHPIHNYNILQYSYIYICTYQSHPGNSIVDPDPGSLIFAKMGAPLAIAVSRQQIATWAKPRHCKVRRVMSRTSMTSGWIPSKLDDNKENSFVLCGLTFSLIKFENTYFALFHHSPNSDSPANRDPDEPRAKWVAAMQGIPAANADVFTRQCERLGRIWSVI